MLAADSTGGSRLPRHAAVAIALLLAGCVQPPSATDPAPSAPALEQGPDEEQGLDEAAAPGTADGPRQRAEQLLGRRLPFRDGAESAPLAVVPPQVEHVAPPVAVKLRAAFDGQAFERAVDARQAPGDDESWYVVEQGGAVWWLTRSAGGAWECRLFLDLRGRVARKHNEEGLLGLAFSPHWGRPGHAHRRAFYVNYSVLPGAASRLSRFTADDDGRAVAVEREEVLLEVEQPWRNHNGGGLAFGPDGDLYYSLGDGGAAGDPRGNAQDPSTLLGSILRLDVDPRQDGVPYGIPADNPLAGRDDAQPEVWAYGLRNVWRFAFDRETGELWAGDVGQDRYEMVFVVRPGGNHGWDLLEGWHRFELPEGIPVPPPLVRPVFEYPHTLAGGLSITGGFVYRGQALPELVGWYVFGDYITQRVWALRRVGEDRVEHTTLLDQAVLMSSFAQGHDGELLVLSHPGGPILRLLPGGGGAASP